MDNILIFGDSITTGEFDTLGGGWADRLKAYIFERRLSGGVPKPIYTYELGIPAQDTAGLKGRILTEAKAREDDGEKSMVLLAIGINDSKVLKSTQQNLVPISDFESTYESILLELANNGFSCSVIGLTRANESAPRVSDTLFVNSEIEKYDSVIQKLAAKHTLDYIPMADLFLDKPELLVDSVHPNAEGHRLMFERVREYLEKVYIL